MDNVSYWTYESATARLDRIIKRLWVVIILLICLLVASNCAWLYYESQFEEQVVTTQRVQQETNDGTNTFVGGDLNGQD